MENADKLLDTGMASLISIAWGIAMIGSILSIPAILFLSIKSGYITSVFNNMKRRNEAAVPQREEQPQENINVQPPIAPFQSTNLTLGEDLRQEFGSQAVEDLIDAINNLEVSRGGRRYNRGRVNRKTRKNKKHKTKKLKYRKNRKTKHKRVNPTRKH